MGEGFEKLIETAAPYVAGFNFLLGMLLQLLKNFMPTEGEMSGRVRAVREKLIEGTANSLEAVLNAIHPRTDTNRDLLADFARICFRNSDKFRHCARIEARSWLYKVIFYLVLLSLLLFVVWAIFPVARIWVGIALLAIAVFEIIALVLLRICADYLSRLESDSEI